MRHFILAAAIAAHPFGMREAAVTTALIAPAGHADAGLTCDLRTVTVAVDLAAVATAANDDLRPAAGAHKQAAGGRHRQSPSMPKRYRRDWWAVPYWPGTRAPCACGARHRSELGGLSRCRACFFGGKPSSTASRLQRHHFLKRAASGASALALRAPSDAPGSAPALRANHSQTAQQSMTIPYF
ncbi:hypothetical protein OKW46_001538 [Paraburkholderia sp. WSM4179]|nr:hypothetical protein [Paraburkholderia sp. WSM4179]MDH6147616.1 hypothetical protein [Paraburkholderia sp. WSM4179]